MKMNKYTEDDYKIKCSELKVEYVGTHKDKHKGTIIEFLCEKHKECGIQAKDWSHFRNLKQPCSYCNGRKRTTEEAQKLVKNPNIIFISEYKGSEKPIKCKCLKCGNEWVSNRPIDLFRRECGCQTCSIKIKTSKRLKKQKEYEHELSLVNPNIKVIGKYTGTHKYIECECLIDGYKWKSFACNLLNGSAGCPKCNMSVGENKIVDFMEKYNLLYTRQKTFDNCRDKLPLKFDVFDEDNNIAIEFQGEQHFFPVDFETNNPQKAKIQFQELKKRDEIKKKYCNDNNIKLICVPYYERNNVEDFLINSNEIYRKLA